MKLLHIARAAAAGIAFAVLSGCAHNITISGDSTELMKTEKTEQIDKVVRLLITDEQRAKDVTSPGGGGDKVTYKPYRDLKFPIYLGLSRTFKQVVKLNAMPDEATARSKGISYLVAPEIVTDSSLASLLTWPPTDFSVTLVCTVTDPTGKQVAAPQIRGTGHAEFEETTHMTVDGQVTHTRHRSCRAYGPRLESDGRFLRELPGLEQGRREAGLSSGVRVGRSLAGDAVAAEG